MAAPYSNKNAEQWNLEDSKELFQKAIELSKDDDYDFIGEIARDLCVYRELFGYLAKKFNELEWLHKTILSNLEANCFSHAKKGTIKEATAIVNLKSNYKWTDRSDLTSNDKEIQATNAPLTKEQLKAQLDELNSII